jgi:hypothetical protein
MEHPRRISGILQHGESFRCGIKSGPPCHIRMAEYHIVSGQKARRSRVAGEMAKRIKELATLDAAVPMLSPDCDPEMFAPIRPSTHGLFFLYRDVTRPTVDISRQAGAPLMLGQIVDRVIEVKGLPDDHRLWQHVDRATRFGC